MNDPNHLQSSWTLPLESGVMLLTRTYRLDIKGRGLHGYEQESTRQHTQ